MKELDKEAYEDLIEHVIEYKDGIGRDQELPNPKYLSRWMDEYGEAFLQKLKAEQSLVGKTEEDAWQAYRALNAEAYSSLDAAGQQHAEECFKNGYKARST